jgi:LacI family transcriptional regulator
MSSRKPSIKEVAALAGVSTATVSNVFSGRKPVNQELRKGVHAAAEALGYQVDRAASQLRSGRTRVIAVLVPDLTDNFFATIVSSLENLAFDEGYDVIVASSRNDVPVESSRLNALMSWKPAGLIVVPCSAVIPPELIAIRDKVPMVLVDRVAVKSAIADTVTIHNRDAGEVAARHLLEMGHTDIVLAPSHLSFPPIGERAEGASAIIEDYTSKKPKIIELGSDVEGGKRIFAGYLERNPIPGAVIAFTNVATLSVLSACAEHHLDIPGRTSIVAFDDYAWMAARKTGLTAIRQPVDEMAAAAWKRLRYRMDGGEPTPVLPTIFNASLVVRDSVRQLPMPKTKVAKVRELVRSETDKPQLAESEKIH